MPWRPVTLVARTVSGADENGDPTYSEQHTDTQAVLWQQQSYEQHQGGTVQYATWRAVLAADAVIGSVDAVDIDGRRFEVEGDPFPAASVARGANHVELTLRARS